MELVTDSNVWYDLAAGRRDIEVLKRDGRRLAATAINFLEMSSKLNAFSFEERRAAAEQVVRHADLVLDTHDRHAAQLCDFLLVPLPFDWMDGFKALANAGSVDELNTGIADLEERVTRTLNSPLTDVWRQYIYNKWVDDVTKAIASESPAYGVARAAGRAKYMKKPAGEALLNKLKSPDGQIQLILAMRRRAAVDAIGAAGSSPYGREPVECVDVFLPYTLAYAQYMFSVATKFTPEPNDRGDLESFLLDTP